MTTDTTLAPDDYLAEIRTSAARIVEVATDLPAAVPTCPGWSVSDVLRHTGAVYSHKVASMRMPEGPQHTDDWDHGPAEDDDLVEWFQERATELLDELEARGTDTPSYTWHPDHGTSGFWYRRMAHETVVHRADVESAVGNMTPVGDATALDGVDEVLDWFLVGCHDDVGPGAPGEGTVAVRTGDHIWRATLLPDSVELSREPGPADAVVSGEPSELLLWLWGRRPDSAVTVDGDAEVLSAFRERMHAVTQ